MILIYFDPNRSGKLSVNEIIHIIRDDNLNERRLGIVKAAYNSLNRNGNETVTIAAFMNGYNVSPNPEFVFKTKTADQIKQEFLQVWDTAATDGVFRWLSSLISTWMYPQVPNPAMMDSMPPQLLVMVTASPSSKRRTWWATPSTPSPNRLISSKRSNLHSI